MSDRLPGLSWSNPVWHRGWRIYVTYDYGTPIAFSHDDFDGAPDANDNRCGYAASVEEAKAEIDEMEAA